MIQISVSSQYSQSFFYLFCKIKGDSFLTNWKFHNYRRLAFQSCTNLLVYLSDLGFILGNQCFSYNTAGRCHICNTIDQDQLAKSSMFVKFIYYDLL